jgi:hypothetical protein
LLAKDELETFEVQFSRCVAGEMLVLFFFGFALLADYLSSSTKVVVQIHIILDEALGTVSDLA